MAAPTIFSPAQLKAIVADVLPLVPDGHTNAVVTTVDIRGAQIVAVLTMGATSRWKAIAAARYDWSGQQEVGGSLVYSW